MRNGEMLPGEEALIPPRCPPLLSYGCDMRAVSEFVCEEEPWAASLLGAGEGAGWELLRLMLSPGTTATPRQLLSSVFFAPPR